MLAQSLEPAPISIDGSGPRPTTLLRGTTRATNETNHAAQSSATLPDSTPELPPLTKPDIAPASVVLHYDPMIPGQAAVVVNGNAGDGPGSEGQTHFKPEDQDGDTGPPTASESDQNGSTAPSGSTQDRIVSMKTLSLFVVQDPLRTSTSSTLPTPKSDLEPDYTSLSPEIQHSTETDVMIIPTIVGASAGFYLNDPDPPLAENSFLAVSSGGDGGAAGPMTNTATRGAGGELPKITAVQSDTFVPPLASPAPLAKPTTQPDEASIDLNHQVQGVAPTSMITTITIHIAKAAKASTSRASTTKVTPLAGLMAMTTVAQTIPTLTTSVLLVGDHLDKSSEDREKSRGASGAPKADSSHDDYGDSQFKSLFAAIVGCTLGAIAIVLLLVLLLVWISRKRATKQKRDSMTLYPRRHPLERKGCENDRMERGVANSSTKSNRLDALGQALWRPFNGVSQFLSRTMLASPLSAVGKRGSPGKQEEVVLNTSTDAGQGGLGRRRAASTLTGGEDFRIGMNLNLQSDSEFNPFSDSQETAALERGHLDDPPVAESSDMASDMPTRSPLHPPSPPSPPFPPPPPPPTALVASLQRLRSQSVGVHRHQFKVLSRIQEPESSDGKDNKFHSDPFDLEFRSRLQSTSGLGAFTQKHGLTPSSSRYTFGPTTELPHIDSFASRPMSGLGYHEWADFGHEIRIAMMGGDDSSTLRSNDSCYSGERTMVEGHHDP